MYRQTFAPLHFPVNTKHLYNICTASAQRLSMLVQHCTNVFVCWVGMFFIIPCCTTWMFSRLNQATHIAWSLAAVTAIFPQLPVEKRHVTLPTDKTECGVGHIQLARSGDQNAVNYLITLTMLKFFSVSHGGWKYNFFNLPLTLSSLHLSLSSLSTTSRELLSKFSVLDEVLQWMAN